MNRSLAKMPLIQAAPETLPYIDAPPSASALSAANALIHADLPPGHTQTLHPSLPAARESRFSPLIEQEHARLRTNTPREPGTGIDLTRYEALDAPTRGDLPAWQQTLTQTSTSAEYLRSRATNLALLETYGKNAWLVGNSRLEDELRSLERDVEVWKLEGERVEQSRRAMQGNVEGEMVGLEEAWKRGVGRMVEAQAAGERVKGEILERRRQGAV